jgi:hypothetical protein
MTGRSPDFILRGLNKTTDEKAPHVGAGWQNDDGSISIVFDRFVALPTDKDWVWTLFPQKPKQKRGA